MSFDATLSQGGEDRRRSQQMSLHRGPPPAQVPGYELECFLGEGAFGQVWVAVEQNTGRRVAIKFYAHRGGLDWSLLSREVEKLSFLFADRYVVQLIGVGWDADPPYYVMEFLEQGSLAERLQEGPMRVSEAVELFREIAIGLVHAHGKGVLHCDLKPANILLDQDGKPRLADFGQSRLSNEQTPALGTLFYMAPEQADLKAVPDARWDVYALGALLYSMLTGDPPHRSKENTQHLDRTADLEQRLAAYRRLIRKSAPPAGHRKIAGVDRQLADIVDRCLAADPEKRYPNVQAVLNALDQRASRRAMRPMMVLGVVGPLLLLLVVAIFAWQGFSTAVRRSEAALTRRALDDNRLTAEYVADLASKELQRRLDAVAEVAHSKRLREILRQTAASEGLRSLSLRLSDPKANEKSPRDPDPTFEPTREEFRRHPDRKRLQQEFESLIPIWMRPSPSGDGERDEVASWFFCDANGLSMARLPESKTLGWDYAWRSFFYGGDRDQPRTWRPSPQQRLSETQLSTVFQSEASGSWIVAIASPVIDRDAGDKFLGVVALTVEVSRFVELEKTSDFFASLVDLRPGEHTGMIVQHPLFDKLRPKKPKKPDASRPDLWEEYNRKDELYRIASVPEYSRAMKDFQQCRLATDDLPWPAEGLHDYRDPLAADPKGQDYDKRWLAQMKPVAVRGHETGWAVIVQESYDSAIGATHGRLRSSLIGYGLAALAMVLFVLFGLWGWAFRLLNESSPLPARSSSTPATERPSTSVTSSNPIEPNEAPRP